VVVLDELFDGLDLMGDMLGGAGPHVRLAQVERVPVGDERVRVEARQVVDVGKAGALTFQCRRHLVLAGGVHEVILREVADVRHVAHKRRVPPDGLGGAHDQVRRQKRPEVADVRVRVHRGPAAVKAQVARLDWFYGLDLVAQRVVEAQRAIGGHASGSW
jgi:hypothetical protein